MEMKPIKIVALFGLGASVVFGGELVSRKPEATNAVKCQPDDVGSCYRMMSDSVSHSAAQNEVSHSPQYYNPESTYERRPHRGAPRFQGTYAPYLGTPYYRGTYGPIGFSYDSDDIILSEKLLRSADCQYVDTASEHSKKVATIEVLNVSGCGPVCLGTVRCTGSLLGRKSKVDLDFFVENVACRPWADGRPCPSARDCFLYGGRLEQTSFEDIMGAGTGSNERKLPGDEGAFDAK